MQNLWHTKRSTVQRLRKGLLPRHLRGGLVPLILGPEFQDNRAGRACGAAKKTPIVLREKRNLA